jgi:hypothetical protein
MFASSIDERRPYRDILGRPLPTRTNHNGFVHHRVIRRYLECLGGRDAQSAYREPYHHKQSVLQGYGLHWAKNSMEKFWAGEISFSDPSDNPTATTLTPGRGGSSVTVGTRGVKIKPARVLAF